MTGDSGGSVDRVILPDGRTATVVARTDAAIYAEPDEPLPSDKIDVTTHRPFVVLDPDAQLGRPDA